MGDVRVLDSPQLLEERPAAAMMIQIKTLYIFGAGRKLALEFNNLYA